MENYMIKFLSDSITTKAFQPYYQELGITDQPKKQQTLVGRVLLANLVGMPVKDAIKNVDIDFGHYGKPYFVPNGYHFNIAHSHDAVLVAIADHPIGVDLEQIRPYDYTRITRAFTPDELEYLKNLKGKRQGEQALRLWTIKEAVLKLQGVGLIGKPKTVVTTLPHMESARRNDDLYQINFLDVGWKYIGTLATQVESENER